jgi:hypothetical protein
MDLGSDTEFTSSSDRDVEEDRSLGTVTQSIPQPSHDSFSRVPG